MRVVLLDNRDSFVYNLVDQFATLGSHIEVYRNNVPVSRVLAALEPTEAGRADPAFTVLDGGPLDVARYHSLGTRTPPEALVSLARTAPVEGVDGIVMAARHRSAPAVGLQFHPESILTPQGPALLRAITAGLARTP